LQAHAVNAKLRNKGKMGAAATAAAETDAAKEMAQQARAMQERFRLPVHLKCVTQM
jgi:hypothetical protein